MNRSQSSTGAACYDCGVNSPILLFTLSAHRFCSNCILKQNKGTFCPFCVELVDIDSSLSNLHVMCLCCHSVAHRSCVPPSTAISCFICPSCIDHTFKFQSVKAIVTAAHISTISLRKAATAARLFTEQSAMEAAIARKKAIDALEKLSTIGSKEEGTSTEK